MKKILYAVMIFSVIGSRAFADDPTLSALSYLKKITGVGQIVEMVAVKDPNYVYAIDFDYRCLYQINTMELKISQKILLPDINPVAVAYSAASNILYIVSRSSNNITTYNIETGEFGSFGPYQVDYIYQHGYDIAVADGSRRILLLARDYGSSWRLSDSSNMKPPYLLLIDMDSKELLQAEPLVFYTAEYPSLSMAVDEANNWVFLINTAQQILKYAFSDVDIKPLQTRTLSLQEYNYLYGWNNMMAVGAEDGILYVPCEFQVTSGDPFATSSATVKPGIRAFQTSNLNTATGTAETTDYPYHIALSPDGKVAYTTYANNDFLYLHNTSTLKGLKKYQFPNARGNWTVFAPNSQGTRVAGFSWDESVGDSKAIYIFPGETIAPAASAGGNRTVTENSIVTLDGSNSNSAVGIVAYEWIQKSGVEVVLSDALAPAATFTAPDVEVDQILVFTLTVTDRNGVKGSDDVRVTVVWDQDPPVANAGEDQEIMEEETVRLNGSRSTDPNDGIAGYKWSQISGPSVVLRDPETARARFTAPNIGPDGSVLEFELTVVDAGGIEDADTISVNVFGVNDSPQAQAGADMTVEEGKTACLDAGESTDPENQGLTYRWRQTSGQPVTLSDSSVAQPCFVPSADPAGSRLTFELTTTDSGGLTGTDTVNVDVTDNGISRYTSDVIRFYSFDGQEIGIKPSDNCGIVHLAAIDPETISLLYKRPETILYGLFDMRIKVANPGDTATVTFSFPQPIPAGYTWFKVSRAYSWFDLGEKAVFNADRTQVTITLVDGGLGDEDGIRNGIIVDPSGVGKPSSSGTDDPSPPDDGSDSSGDTDADLPPMRSGNLGEEGGCFVSSFFGRN